MCRPGNQTIFRECRDEALRRLGQEKASNKELRAVIEAHRGCLKPRKKD